MSSAYISDESRSQEREDLLLSSSPLAGSDAGMGTGMGAKEGARRHRLWHEQLQAVHAETRRLGWYLWARTRPRWMQVAFVSVIFCCAIAIFQVLRSDPHPPFPWRDQCRTSFPTHYALSPTNLELEPLHPSHPAWPYPEPTIPLPGSADRLESVTIFIGVFTVGAAVQRRQIIRETYARQAVKGVKIVFVLGQAEDEVVESEAALYGDMVFLPIRENMNLGKTYSFFAWAAKHASVHGTAPQYVMKADDDAFIMLDELERRMRLLPRQLAYWGLLMFGEYKQQAWQSEYMTGGGYVLSFDLVQHFARDDYAWNHRIGHEDQLVGDWIRRHPQADRIVWVTERCWMYDHPRQTGWALSHGFLFPNVVAHIRSSTEQSAGHLPSLLPSHLLRSWSTVTEWLVPYHAPYPHLSIDQKAEAMIEGSPLSLLHPHNHRYSDHAQSRPRPPEHGTGRDLPHGRVAEEVDIENAWRGRPTKEERMKGREETGSTVLVHEVKQHAWWIETAYILLGPNDSVK